MFAFPTSAEYTATVHYLADGTPHVFHVERVCPRNFYFASASTGRIKGYIPYTITVDVGELTTCG